MPTEGFDVLGLDARGHEDDAARVDRTGRHRVSAGQGTLGLHRVEAHHFVENPASGRVLEHVGMTAEGVHRGVVWRDDRPRDLRSYAILRTDPR